MDDRLKDSVYKILKEPKAVRRLFARRFFRLIESAGFHVTADHFYEPIPNTREIEAGYSAERRNLVGIDFDLAASEHYITKILDKYAAEFYDTTKEFGYYEDNAYYRGVDALILYCVIREINPRRMIEVGQGFSTRVSIAALERNAAGSDFTPHFISVDPYARFTPDAKNIKFEILKQPLQDSIEFVTQMLEDGDFLFVDSSHVYKFGSDVRVIIDEIYPNIKPGVVIHIHDIFSPYDYPKSWLVNQKRFWNEQYHLEHFLQFNPQYSVLIALHLCMRESPALVERLRTILPAAGHLYLGQSLYILRTGAEAKPD